MAYQPSCRIEGCDRRYMARGFCSVHYDRNRRGSDMLAAVRVQRRSGECRVDGCEVRAQLKSSLCSIHGNVRYRYRIEPERLEEMLTAQSHKCAVCDDSLGAKWVVDHDHACCAGKGRTCGECIRGILCARCNLALGHARESVEILSSLISYLTEWGQS